MDRKIKNFRTNEINPLLSSKMDEKNILNTFNNINNELENRPTNDEIFKILNEKVDKKELIYYLNSKPSTNDLYNNRKKIEEIQKNLEAFQNNIYKVIGGNTQQRADIVDLKNILQKKANLEDVAEALELKADQENVITFLNEIKESLKNKADKSELMNINEEIKNINEELKNNVEIFKEGINNNINDLMKNKSDINDFKLISDAFQDMKSNMTQRIDDIDNDLDRLIENIKAQFQSTNILISNVDNKKVENKEIEEINNILLKKLDEDKFNNLFNQFKDNIFDTINSFKKDYLTNIKIFENKIDEKNEALTQDYNSIINELNSQNNSINEFMNNEREEINTINKKLESIINNYNAQNNSSILKIKDDLKKLNININEKINKKLDEEKFDLYLLNIKKEINSKVSLFNTKKNNEELMSTVEQKLNNLSSNIKKELDGKISMSDIQSSLDNKADLSLLKDKISLIDFNNLKEYIKNMDFELKQKIDIDNFNNCINTINKNIDNIHNELISKAEIDDVNLSLKKKINIEDINNLKNDINLKVDRNEFNNAMNNQALINDIICNENQVGRWLWKSGKIKGGFTIPWDTQSINTSPDNYIWEKDKTIINVVKGGIYKVSLGFYSNKKPNIQIIVNNEMIISANNSNNNNNGKNNGNINSNRKLKKMTGLSLIDFIILQDNSNIAVTYIGEEGFGFIGLKKL